MFEPPPAGSRSESDPQPEPASGEGGEGWVVHEDHGLTDAWLVTLRAQVSGRDDVLHFERSLPYGDGAAVIAQLRAAGSSHADALGALWWGVAETAAAELAYELTIPDASHRPPYARELRDPGGSRVLSAAQEREQPVRSLAPGEPLCPIGPTPRHR